MKFMAIGKDVALGATVISENNWSELDINLLLKEDSQYLAILLSSNQVVVANSGGAPCPNTAKQLIFRLLTK